MVEKLKAENVISESQVKDFLKNTLKEIMGIFRAECGSLFFFDSQSKELVLDSFFNTKKIETTGIRFRMGQGVSGKVMEKRAPVVVTNIDIDSRFRKNGYKHYQTKSFMSIPLVGPDKRILGLINVADKTTGEPFNEQDLKLAATLTDYASLIAHNLSVSERLKKEKDALDKQNSLLEKYASVGKLAAGVVHEINNPLDGILRFTNILLNQIDDHSVTKEYLIEIKKGLNRIDNITKSLLQFSRQVNFNDLKNKSYVDLTTMIEDTLNIFSTRVFSNIKVQKSFHAGRIKILDIGLAHVFINIVKNAIDVMPGGGSLDIHTQIENSFILASFKDSGPGVPEALKDRIFEPFFTTKNMDKGSGLGLSICKEIVNRYEGRIEVESSPGQGSTFRVLIPLKYAENV